MEEHNRDDQQAGGLVPFKTGDDSRRGRGPTPGAPNAGRPPDAVRAACRAAFDQRVPLLAQLADSGTPDIQLRAMDMLGRYGLGTSFTLDGHERTSGVIILPALEIRDYLESAGHPRPALRENSGEEIEYEYVIEELETGEPAKDETVNPDIVREVLARRQTA